MQRGFFKPGEPRVAGVVAGKLDLRNVKKAERLGADLLEIRVDTLKGKNPEQLAGIIEKIKKNTKLPIILTVRSAREGGAAKIPDKERERIFYTLGPFCDLIDIELSSGAILKNVVDFSRRLGKKVIISYHNFKTTPGIKTLRGIMKKGRDSGADFIKIACLSRGGGDFLRLAEILSGSDDLIVIAMGGRGSASRVFFPMIGSLVTYGPITVSTAPGQFSLGAIKKQLKLYGF